MARPNRHQLPPVTRVVIKGGQFVDNVAPARCQPGDPASLVVVNTDGVDYVLQMTGFKNKGANTAVNEGDLFKNIAGSVQIPRNDTTPVRRHVKAPGNWGTANGQFPYTTYECTLQLFDSTGTKLLDELDPDFDITP
jgi:hypothetical protein